MGTVRTGAALVATGVCAVVGVASALAACGQPAATGAPAGSPGGSPAGWSAAAAAGGPTSAGARAKPGAGAGDAVRSAPAVTKAPEVARNDLAGLVASRPDVFVGLGRERHGVAIVALNPGVDVRVWRPVVDRYAGSEPHLVTICTRSLSELLRVADELTARRWSPRAATVAFAVATDPVTCSTQLTSADLTPAEKLALTQRFGGALTIVDAPVGRA
jgi:hypothetical protein